MTRDNSPIIVAGDPAIDWLQWKTPPKKNPGNEDLSNCQLYPGFHKVARKGGVLGLARLVELATNHRVATHELPRDEKIENILPSEIIHSHALIDLYKNESGGKIYRVKKFCGYSIGDTIPKPPKIKEDNELSSLVIIDDAGNSFRYHEDVWPKAILSKRNKPIVILKLSPPLLHSDNKNKLWEFLLENYNENLVVIVSADALRQSGILISQCQSWEKSVEDFLWHMKVSPDLDQFSKCRNLILRFGLDGAIHYQYNEKSGVSVTLHYDPGILEEGYKQRYGGDMQGVTFAFVAALASEIKSNSFNGIEKGIKNGIVASRRFFKSGFGNQSEIPDYPGKEIFDDFSHEEALIADTYVPSSVINRSFDQRDWTILKELGKHRLEYVAINYLAQGHDSLIDRTPKGIFGKLLTIDRGEIESYQAIRNLMLEYIAKKETGNPLCIAVFGQPGSGKSFGVKQLADSIAGDKVTPLEFNLAQFSHINQLTGAFHQIRDVALKGNLPLVFFDEFDASFENNKLGWLKYFLAPMQDGVFKEGELLHPLGKSIFVFAGGTSHTFEAFNEPDKYPSAHTKGEYIQQKGVDFVSRLRGFINIQGCNPKTPGSPDDDPAYIIRRAMLIRSVLSKEIRSFDDPNFEIDPGVVNALLRIPEYKHGVRSIQAIFQMSMLEGERKFGKSAVPSIHQLNLHIDGVMFYQLMLQNVLYGESLEQLAKMIHEQYLLDMKGEDPSLYPAMKPWEDISEHYRDSNRRQASFIPDKLKKLGYGLCPVINRPIVLKKFSKEEIEKLAMSEHDYWMVEKTDAGWQYGSPRSDVKKLHPCLVGWDELPKLEKDKDRESARRIPDLLASAGFEIYTLH